MEPRFVRPSPATADYLAALPLALEHYEYGSAGGTELAIDLDTGLMRLATGGSAG